MRPLPVGPVGTFFMIILKGFLFSGFLGLLFLGEFALDIERYYIPLEDALPIGSDFSHPGATFL